MCIACWINKATDTHSEYVIIRPFAWQQLLRKRASMLRLYIHCISCYVNKNIITIIIITTNSLSTVPISTGNSEYFLYINSLYSYNPSGTVSPTMNATCLKHYNVMLCYV
jgi:hypothetical protein